MYLQNLCVNWAKMCFCADQFSFAEGRMCYFSFQDSQSPALRWKMNKNGCLSNRDVYLISGTSFMLSSCYAAKNTIFCLPLLWLAHPQIEKLRVWPITHLFLRVSHCCSWSSEGYDLLGMWAVSTWLTSDLITIHQWEQAYSQAYRLTCAAFSWMVKWLISSWHIRLLIINKHHTDRKHHTRLAVWIS